MAFNQGIIRDLRGYLDQEQIDKLISAMNSDRDKLLIRLLMVSGRRVTEIVGRKEFTYTNKKLISKDKLTGEKKLGFIKDYPQVKGITPADINWEEGLIAFNILKKRHPLKKLKAVDSQTLIMLRSFIESNHIAPEEEIFKIRRSMVDRIIKKAGEESGVLRVGTKKPHAHHFRHTFAIRMLKNSKHPDDLRKVQQHLEHANLNMTSQYLQFSADDTKEMLEEMFNKHKVEPPLSDGKELNTNPSSS